MEGVRGLRPGQADAGPARGAAGAGEERGEQRDDEEQDQREQGGERRGQRWGRVGAVGGARPPLRARAAELVDADAGAAAEVEEDAGAGVEEAAACVGLLALRADVVVVLVLGREQRSRSEVLRLLLEGLHAPLRTYRTGRQSHRPCRLQRTA